MLKKIQRDCLSYFNQFVRTIPMHKEAFYFLKKHQPWKGMEKYNWAAWVLLVAAVLLGYYFFRDTFFFVKDIFNNTGNLKAGASSFFTDFSFEKMDWALHGSKKYLILIVLEIFIFHFVQKTLELQIGRKSAFTFKVFIAAEKRMIRASIYAWIMEIIVTAVTKAIIGLFGLGFLLDDAAGLLIQFYFLGFIIIDNYHECFGLTLKESSKRTKKVVGVALAIGGVAYALMYLPLIGVVAATMLGAVTCTLAMQQFAPFEASEESV